MNSPIRPGDIVIAETADGGEARMRALGAPVAGRDFPVVWVATEAEFERAQAHEDEPAGIPWPLTAIRVVDGVTS
jgi:hypothetical protein